MNFEKYYGDKNSSKSNWLVPCHHIVSKNSIYEGKYFII